ncbi:MAG: tRNA glutamyl-Q(34) synthetase GluQRS [Phycisphaeraceae bacterium]
MSDRRTRLAPSPTGALHLGNARTFLINWAMARQQNWTIVLRVEDLDGPRVKEGADKLAIDILQWLGLDWDEGPHYQRHDLTRYHAALDRLAGQGLIYPCQCTRGDIAAAARSAPHEGDEHELRYPGTCRPAAATPTRFEPALDATAWRVRVPDQVISFTDQVAGEQAINVAQGVGDFVLSTRMGLPAYQLAVVVDDAAQHITDVVRGDDLVPSAARQIMLQQMLNIAPQPRYTHLPLVYGPDGRRLAKRHGDTRLTTYRKHGVSAERIIGLLGHWSGLGPRQPMTLSMFLERFDLARLPRQPITFTADDEKWLLTK